MVMLITNGEMLDLLGSVVDPPYFFFKCVFIRNSDAKMFISRKKIPSSTIIILHKWHALNDLTLKICVCIMLAFI
jgi:hypothetical protein